jgi:hypothetical protein
MIDVGCVNDEEYHGKRDAYHVPAVMVKSNEPIAPGAGVKFVEGCEAMVVPCPRRERHGVADPFIPTVIDPGDCFLVFIEPKLVEGKVSHHFKIKGIPSKNDVEDKEVKAALLRMQDANVDLTNQIDSKNETIEELQREVQTWKDKAYSAESELADDSCRGCY